MKKYSVAVFICQIVLGLDNDKQGFFLNACLMEILRIVQNVGIFFIV